MGYRVFISYSTHDIEYARLVQRSLRNLGFEAFLADNSLGPGQNLLAIHNQIRTCHSLVALWSKEASDSAWVREEIGVAQGALRTVIPVQLAEGCTFPPSLTGVKHIAAIKRDTTSVLDIQSAVAAHYQLLLQQDAAHRAAWEAETARQQAENNQKALVVIGLGAAALLAIGASK